MHKLTAETVKELLTIENQSPAITIYLPSHRNATPPNMSEDQIRFKNLSSKALKLLDERDKHDDFNQQFRDKCNELLDSMDFWEHLTESVLICARPGMFEYYHLPIDSDEYVAVDDHLHLTPVLGLINDMRQYYVLQIAQHHPRLFKGDMYELVLADLELPATLEDALNIDEMYQKSLQFSSVNSPKGAMYHGHGGGKDTGDDERTRFWRLIDGMVCYDIDTKIPLILAGVESEIAEYRAVTKHPRVLDQTIDGSFNGDAQNKLHEKSLEIIRSEIVHKQHANALERFEALQGQAPERTASHLDDLQDAAENGRIDTLLVGMSRETTDTVRDNKHAVAKLVFPADEDNEAIDHLARQVFSQSGSVVNLFQDQMPEHKLMLAINRY